MNNANNTHSQHGDSDLSVTGPVALDAPAIAANSPVPSTASFQSGHPPPPNCDNSYAPPGGHHGLQLSDNKSQKDSGDNSYRLNVSQDVHRTELTKPQSHDHGSGLRSGQLSVQPHVRETPLDRSTAVMRLQQIVEHVPEPARPPFGSIDNVLTSGSAPRSASHFPLYAAISEQVTNGNSSSHLTPAPTALEPTVREPVVYGSDFTVENRHALCPPPNIWRERNSIQLGGLGGLDGAQVRQRPRLHRAPPYVPQDPAFLDPNIAPRTRLLWASRSTFDYDSRVLPSSSGPSTPPPSPQNPSSNSSPKEDKATSGAGEPSGNPQTEAALQEYFRYYDSRSDHTRSLILEYHVEKIFDNISDFGSDSAVPSDLDQSLSLSNGNAPLPAQKHTPSRFHPNRENSHQVRWSRSPNSRVHKLMTAEREIKNAAKKVEVVGAQPEVNNLLHGHNIGGPYVQRNSSQAEIVDGDAEGEEATPGERKKEKFWDWLKGIWRALKNPKRVNHFMRKERRMTLD